MRPLHCTVLGLIGLVSACGSDSDAPIVVSDQAGLIEPLFLIEHDFGKVANVELGLEGRIYVADSQTREIAVFDSSGLHLNTLGGLGHGPGEFTHLNSISVRDSLLSVVDHGASRLTILSLTDSLRPVRVAQRLEDLGEGFSPSWWHVFAAPDRMLVLFKTVDLIEDSVIGTPDRLHWMNLDGRVDTGSGVDISNERFLSVNRSVMPMPFGGSLDLLALGDGRVVIADSSIDSLIVLGSNGSQGLRLQGLPARPVQEEDVDRYVESITHELPLLQEMLRENVRLGAAEGLLPDQYPSFLGIAASETGLWVQLTTSGHRHAKGALGPEYLADEEVVVLFDLEGVPSDTIRIAGPARLEAADEGRLVFVSVDALGVERVLIVPIA